MPGAAATHRLPLWLKLVYTAFVAVLVPVYLANYGPTNFLYFCDVAVLVTLAAVWLESSLLASAALIGIFLVQMVWVVDFLGILIGHPLNNMTAYMFDARRHWFLRGLSLFHFWLPFFLVGLVWRLGYDRRALVLWTLLAWLDLSVCYFLMPAPPLSTDDANRPVNINYVYGFDDAHAQTWSDPNVYFALVMVVLPVGILLPSHLVCRAVFRPPHGAAPSEGGRG